MILKQKKKSTEIHYRKINTVRPKIENLSQNSRINWFRATLYTEKNFSTNFPI